MTERKIRPNGQRLWNTGGVKTRKNFALIALAGMVVVLLSGCVRFQADLTITPDDTLNGTIVVAAVAGNDTLESKTSAQGIAAQIEKRLLPDVSGADGVTREPYAKDNYYGSTFTFKNTPISALAASGNDSGSLSITRDGNDFVFSGKLDFSPDDQSAPPKDADTTNITVAITFPGEVVEHNGQLNGTQVSWKTSYEGSIDMHARANATPIGPPVWVWVVVEIGVLIAVAVGVFIIMRSFRGSADRDSADAATAGAARKDAASGRQRDLPTS